MTCTEALDRLARQAARDMIVIASVAFCAGAGLATLLGAMA